MKVFLSWSGARSKQVGLALQEWLPYVLQYVDPWLSANDITAGAKWFPELDKQLQESKFGIICVTLECINSPWLLFEAGALSKTVTGSWVCPYLLGVDIQDLIASPLVNFQMKKADQRSTLELVQSLNKAAKAKGIKESVLTVEFEKHWPDLERKLDEIQRQSTTPAPKRNQTEILEEMAIAIQSVVRMVGRLEPSSGLGQNASSPFTDQDIVDTFSKIPYLTREEISAALPECRRGLNANGVISKERLNQLAECKTDLQWLEEVYVEELLRDPKKPLDPSGVAGWLGFLFANGRSASARRHVLMQLRESKEYRMKHKSTASRS